MSAAVSVSSSVSSSSALRKRGLQTVTTAALPCRSTLAGPKLIAPRLANSSPRSIASRLGSSIDLHRCMPAVRNGEHLREKNALVDLDAVFLGLHQCAFGIDLLVRRRQAGNELPGLIDQIVHTHEIRRFLVSLR